MTKRSRRVVPTPKRLAKGLVLAVTMLTRIPLPFQWCDMRAVAVAPAWFPLAGWLLAVLAMLPVELVFLRWGLNPPEITLVWVAPVLFIAALAWLTRGFHFDGWCDCCDALMAVATRERRREILKDSRVGSGAVLGGVILIITKTVCLLALTIANFYGGFDFWAICGLYVGPVVIARLASSLLTFVGKPSTGSGMAARFVGRVSPVTVLIAVMSVLPLLWLLPPVKLGALVAVGLVTAAWWRWKANDAFGGVNGDVLGATVETSETLMYLALLLI